LVDNAPRDFKDLQDTEEDAKGPAKEEAKGPARDLRDTEAEAKGQAHVCDGEASLGVQKGVAEAARAARARAEWLEEARDARDGVAVNHTKRAAVHEAK
jgi:hypothetical protein